MAAQLPADTPPEEIARAGHAVARGESLLSPAGTRAVTERLVAQPSVDRVRVTRALAALPDREREVAQEIAAGRSNADIAKVLLMSGATVTVHGSHALTETASTNRVQLALLVRDAQG